MRAISGIQRQIRRLRAIERSTDKGWPPRAKDEARRTANALAWALREKEFVQPSTALHTGFYDRFRSKP